jgi:hypothetical protein
VPGAGTVHYVERWRPDPGGAGGRSRLTASVVVATHSADRMPLVERCVRSVARGAAVPTETIVVVDSNPALRDALRRRFPHGVRVVDGMGSGASQARNTGLSLATGDVVAYLDDDADPDCGWLLAILTVFEQRPTVVGVGGRIVPEYDPAARKVPPELLWIVGCTYRGHRVDEGPISRPIGASMAFRVTALREIGGFSPSFGPDGFRQTGRATVALDRKTGSNEELALALALRQRFGEEVIWYCPGACVRHFVPAARTMAQYLVHRCWVEGATKAEVTALHDSTAMNDDRRYLLGVLLPSIVSGVARAGRRRDVHALGDALKLVSGATITVAGYVATVVAQRARGRVRR